MIIVYTDNANWEWVTCAPGPPALGFARAVRFPAQRLADGLGLQMLGIWAEACGNAVTGVGTGYLGGAHVLGVSADRRDGHGTLDVGGKTQEFTQGSLDSGSMKAINDEDEV